jgi:hypothetical protein
VNNGGEQCSLQKMESAITSTTSQERPHSTHIPNEWSISIAFNKKKGKDYVLRLKNINNYL